MDSKCPKCDRKSWRDGHVLIHGVMTQRFFCRRCNFHYTNSYIRRKREQKLQAFLSNLLSGMSISEISTRIEVHRSTVSRWVNERADIEEVKTLQVRVIQLYMEAISIEEISDLLSINLKIVKKWIDLFKERSVNELPRLKEKELRYNYTEGKRTFSINGNYGLCFSHCGEQFSILTRPADYVPSSGYGSSLDAFKNLRLIQLYLNGARKSDLLQALKYERIDKLNRKLKAIPVEVRVLKEIGGRGIGPASFSGSLLIETNEGYFALLD